MTNEEMQRAIEFIIEHQVQYTTRTEKNESRLIKLEDAFVTLTEMARLIDERMDSTDQRTEKNESRLIKFEDAFVMLTEMARLTDVRMDAMDVRVDTLGQAMDSLGQTAQAHTDERLNVLIDTVDRYISKNGNAPKN
jgi:hypothetical protein